MNQTSNRLFGLFASFRSSLAAVDWKQWLPSRGNFIFVMLIALGFIWAQSSGVLARSEAQSSGYTRPFPYQGRLADASGTPLTNTYPMIFRLYASGIEGVPLWEENWSGPNSVRVSDGLFSVMLGSLSPIPDGVITGNSNLWLGITVGTDDEMTPRIQLGSVPFSHQAQTVTDGSITTEKLVDQSITSEKIADGTISSTDMAPNAVTSTNITDGTVESIDIADGTISSVDITDGTISGADITNSTITGIDVADNTITGVDILDGTITGVEIANGAISDSKVSLSYIYPNSGNVILAGTAVVGGLNINGTDLFFSPNAERGDGGRALVLDWGDVLRLNYNGDFSGGVIARNFRTGGIVEENLQTEEEQAMAKIDRFSQGDILCWDPTEQKLDKCLSSASPLVVAVADINGRPIIMGAEPANVLGPVEPGDLLVSSDVPGFAEAWRQENDPSAGTIIGKALEGCNVQTCLIKVLIMLR